MLFTINDEVVAMVEGDENDIMENSLMVQIEQDSRFETNYSGVFGGRSDPDTSGS